MRQGLVPNGAGYNLAVQAPSAEMKTQPGGDNCFLSFALLLENHQDLNPRG